MSEKKESQPNEEQFSPKSPPVYKKIKTQTQDIRNESPKTLDNDDSILESVKIKDELPSRKETESQDDKAVEMPVSDRVGKVDNDGIKEKANQIKKTDAGSKKSLPLVILFVLILSAGAFFAYSYYQSKNNGESPINIETDVAEDVEAAAEAIKKITGIIYSHRDSSEPFSVFTRPIDGGERQSIQQLPSGDLMPESSFNSRYGSQYLRDGSVLFYTDQGVVYAANTSSVNEIFRASGNVVVQGIALNLEKTKFTLLTTNKDTGASKLQIITTGGIVDKDLPIDSEHGDQPVPIAWSSNNGAIYHTRSCYPGCGQFEPGFYGYNIDAKDSFQYFEAVPEFGLITPKVNSDFSQVIFGSATQDPSRQSDEFASGFYLGAPYSISTYEVRGRDIQKIATLEKANDTTEGEVTTIGWVKRDSGDTPFYVIDNKFVEITSGGETTLLETGDTIARVFWASQFDLVVGTEVSVNGEFDGFLITHFDLSTNKAATVMETGLQTSILGFTFE